MCRIQSIHQGLVPQEAITGVGTCVWGVVNNRLQRGEVAYGNHGPTHNGMRDAINRCDEGGALLFVSTTVSSSFNSTVLRWSDCGERAGSWSAVALTQLMTV